jgi:hypothetical protein
MERVQLFDCDGKVRWEAAAPGVVTATWLPNGHVLLANHSAQLAIEQEITNRLHAGELIDMDALVAAHPEHADTSFAN